MSNDQVSCPKQKSKSSPRIQNLQQSERRLGSSSTLSNFLAPLNKFDDSLDTSYFSNPKSQAKLDQLVSILNQNKTFSSPRGILGYTNSVLLNISSNQDIEVFLPGYMRMKIRSLIKVDINSQQTQVNALIQFSIYYGKLPRLIVDYLKQSLILRFSKKNSILLKETQQSDLSIKVSQDDSLELITFSIDLPITFHFQPYYPFDWINIDMSIWVSPFEKINNLLTVTIEQLVVRYDDLMVEFADIYSQQQFEQVQSYFKHLKKFNGQIRKLIVKVNLMNLCQPHLQIPKAFQKIIKREETNHDKDHPGEQILLSKLMREKYSQMASIYIDIQSEGNSPMKKFQFTKPEMESEFRIYQLNQQLSILESHYSMSPNKLTYEEEHLLGQYQIVSSELNVRFSCYKYLKLMKKLQIHTKIYSYIQQMRTEGYQKLSRVDSKQKQIMDKIILKQKLNNEFSSNPEIMIPQFGSQILIKKPPSDKKIEIKPEIETSQKRQNNKDIIKLVAQEMQKGKQGPKTFQFAHFELSIYKHPFVPLAIVFFPLWIIATINLIIYFSAKNLNDRISNIATLLIAYVAYFPIFRQQIPEYRYLLLAEIFAYLQIVCSFLTLLHSLIYEENQSNSEQGFDINSVGAVFWISFGITTFTILTVIIAYIAHKFFVQPKFKLRNENKIQTTSLRHILWNNYQCDFAFLKKQNLVHLSECLQFSNFLKDHYPEMQPQAQPIKIERNLLLWK